MDDPARLLGLKDPWSPVGYKVVVSDEPRELDGPASAWSGEGSAASGFGYRVALLSEELPCDSERTESSVSVEPDAIPNLKLKEESRRGGLLWPPVLIGALFLSIAVLGTLWQMESVPPPAARPVAHGPVAHHVPPPPRDVTIPADFAAAPPVAAAPQRVPEAPVQWNVQPVVQPEVALPAAIDGKCDGERFGTSVSFARNPQEAARIAGRAHKLTFLLHVSGNFEDNAFT